MGGGGQVGDLIGVAGEPGGRGGRHKEAVLDSSIWGPADEEVGISWNLLVEGVEEDSELIVINDASIDCLGHVLLIVVSRQAG